MTTMKTRQLVYIAIFTILTTVGGFIRISLPFTTVKLTFQVLFVIMAGFFLGPRDGALSQIAYIFIGLTGLPIFSNGGGIYYVLEPSFGYLLSFPLAAYLSGFILHRFRTLHIFKTFLAALAGLIVINLIGVSYQLMIMAYYLQLANAVLLAAIPMALLYLAKDAVLLLVLCVLFPKLSSMIKISRKNRSTMSDTNEGKSSDSA